MTVHQLQILQYNIHKEKNGTMAPLLQGHLSHLPDIMAIQEPWQNPHSPTTYNPRDSNYHLAFAPTDHTHAYFYIVAVRTVPPDQVRLIGSTGLDSGLVLAERSVKEWVGVLRDSGGGLLGTVLHTR